MPKETRKQPSSRSWGALRGAFQYGEQEVERQARLRSRLDHGALERETEGFEPEGSLGDATLGTRQDVRDHRDLNFDGRGIPLGKLRGKELSFDGPGSLITYGQPGLGKLTRVIARLLIKITSEDGGQFDRSIVFNDVAQELEASVGSRIPEKIIHAPARFGERVQGLARYNPLGDAARHLDTPTYATIVDEMALALRPPDLKAGENSWIGEDGRTFIFSPVMRHGIYLHREKATLGWVHDQLFGGKDHLKRLFRDMSVSPDESVRAAGEYLLYWQEDGDREFGIVLRDCLRHLRMFEPGSFLRKASDASDFDPADLKRDVGHVFYQMPLGVLNATGRYTALFLNSVMRSYAEAMEGDTRCLFLIDEASNIGRMPFLRESIRLLRKRGVSAWLFFQSRKAAEQVYGEDGRIDFEEICALIQVLTTDDPGMLKDLSFWSGTTSVETLNVTAQTGAVESVSRALSEQTRPLLQTENLRGMRDDECLIKVLGAPLFLVKNPDWFKDPRLAGALNDPRNLPGMI